MSWVGQKLAFSQLAIDARVPECPGVYAIWRLDQWIYIGETANLHRRLTEHLEGDNVCIASHRPTSCGFEICLTDEQRVARRNQLIQDMRPACNQVFG